MIAIDWIVIRSAALAGLFVLVPSIVVLTLVLDDSASSLWIYVFGLLLVFGFLTVGDGAGRARSDTPMIHGAIAGLSCYLVIQLFGSISRPDPRRVGQPSAVSLPRHPQRCARRQRGTVRRLVSTQGPAQPGQLRELPVGLKPCDGSRSALRLPRHAQHTRRRREGSVPRAASVARWVSWPDGRADLSGSVRKVGAPQNTVLANGQSG